MWGNRHVRGQSKCDVSSLWRYMRGIERDPEKCTRETLKYRERLWNMCGRKTLKKQWERLWNIESDSEMCAQNHERLSNTCEIDSEILTETLKPPKNREIALLLATNRWCVVKYVSQKQNKSNDKKQNKFNDQWYHTILQYFRDFHISI